MKTSISRPAAFIAIGKNRQKIYGGNTVYLPNKQEFEFEFENFTTENVMARISINGKAISNRGIVLRVGQRGFLDRYIDEARKFLFETYVVDGNSEQAKKAVEDNGNIKIEFFREKKVIPEAIYTQVLNICASAGASYTSPRYSKGKTRSASLFDSAVEKLYDSVDNAPEERSRGFDGMNQTLSRKSLVETGRVEKGSTSYQGFNEISMDFEYFSFCIVEYKLLPLSQKPAELNDLKLKCNSCGSKIKSNWNVCPFCGTPIDEECKCASCGIDTNVSWDFCPNCGVSLK